MLLFFASPLSGACTGTLELVEVVNSVEECIDKCVASADCEWWNFDHSDGFCTLLSTCTDVIYICTTCTYGSRACGDNGPTQRKSLPDHCHYPIISL